MYYTTGKIATPDNSNFKDWHTWDEWKNLGFVVIKGEKATKYKTQNYFHKLQVTPKLDKIDRYILSTIYD